MPKPRYHVLVCTNTRPPDNPKGSCGPKGADDIVDRLKALVRERGKDAEIIKQTMAVSQAIEHVGCRMAVQVIRRRTIVWDLQGFLDVGHPFRWTAGGF